MFRRRDNGQKDQQQQRLSPSTPSTPQEGPTRNKRDVAEVNKIYTEQDVAKIMTRAYDPGRMGGRKGTHESSQQSLQCFMILILLVLFNETRFYILYNQ